MKEKISLAILVLVATICILLVGTISIFLKKYTDTTSQLAGANATIETMLKSEADLKLQVANASKALEKLAAAGKGDTQALTTYITVLQNERDALMTENANLRIALSPLPENADINEAIEAEYEKVQAAVTALMVENNLSTLPHPVTAATNDMRAFPDVTSQCGIDKIRDPQGLLFTRGKDKDGYVLFQQDNRADAYRTSLFNYVTTRYTRGTYIVNADGTVTQVSFP